MQRTNLSDRLSQWWHRSILVSVMSQSRRMIGGTVLRFIKAAWSRSSADAIERAQSNCISQQPKNEVQQIRSNVISALVFERKRRESAIKSDTALERKAIFLPGAVVPLIPIGKDTRRVASFKVLSQASGGMDDYLRVVWSPQSDELRRRMYATVVLVRLRERANLGLVESKYPLYGRARIRKLRS